MAMQISQRKGGGKGWVEVSVKYVWENDDRDFRLHFILVQSYHRLTQSFVSCTD